MELRLLIPTCILAAAAVVAGFYAKLKQQEGTLNVRAVVLFVLLTIAVFGLTSLLTLWESAALLTVYIIEQALALLVGGLVAYSIYAAPPAPRRFLSDLLFVILMTLLGVLALWAGWTFLGTRSELAPHMATGAIPLIIPFLFHKSYQLSAAIPEPIYELWYLPLGKDTTRLEDYAQSTPVLISVQLQPSAANPKTDTFELYAPEDMRWGECFYNVMLEYNLNKPYPADLEDATGKPYAFNFHVQRGFLKGRHYLNPLITVRENKLTKSETIVAERA